MKAGKADLHFIETKLRPKDKMGVLSSSIINGLRLHEFLTNNQKKVREVIRRPDLSEIASGAKNLEREY
jgi:hypothetical protein